MKLSAAAVHEISFGLMGKLMDLAPPPSLLVNQRNMFYLIQISTDVAAVT
jgi:hypothetical protein